jgi:hypothetical protein
VGVFGRKSGISAISKFPEVVARMRLDYAAGRFNEVCSTARKYEELAFEHRDSSESEWFWFNAYAALAGLKSQHSIAGDVAAWCGFATTSGFGVTSQAPC